MNTCKRCNKLLSGPWQKTFCSSSCAATYNNSKFPKRKRLTSKLTHCKFCNKKLTAWQTKYCSRECSKEFRFFEVKRPLVLSGKYSRVSRTILKRVLKEVWGVPKCVLCGIGEEWNEKPLTLQIDHIDGNPDNNEIENLRWVYPNCHSQTDTFCSKNGSMKKIDSRNQYRRKNYSETASIV